MSAGAAVIRSYAYGLPLFSIKHHAASWWGERLCSAPDARHYFLLSCQKKVSKEKSRPPRRPAAPGSLRCSATTGGLRNSGLRPSDSPRPFSRCVLRCSTTQRAGGKPCGDQPTTIASNSARCWPPLDDAEQRSAAGGSRRGLSEGRSPEFRSRPAVRVAEGTPPQAGRRRGVAFSLASFFWRPKRKNARASGAEHSLSNI